MLARLHRPKRMVVTAGMPYANGPLHLGHLAGAHLPADISARYSGMLIGRENEAPNKIAAAKTRHFTPALLRGADTRSCHCSSPVRLFPAPDRDRPGSRAEAWAGARVPAALPTWRKEGRSSSKLLPVMSA